MQRNVRAPDMGDVEEDFRKNVQIDCFSFIAGWGKIGQE